MNKIFFYAIALFLGLAIMSCGKTENSEEAENSEESKHLAVLNVNQVSIPTKLKGVVEIIPEDDGKLHIDYDGNYHPVLEITFRLVKNVDNISGYLQGLALDSKGRELTKLSDTLGHWDGEDAFNRLRDFIKEGEIGETITFTFKGNNGFSPFADYTAEEIESQVEETTKDVEKIATFKLSF